MDSRSSVASTPSPAYVPQPVAPVATPVASQVEAAPAPKRGRKANK